MKKALMLTAVLAVAGWALADIQPISGTNVVGFAAVSVPGAANTIITVPFDACMGAGTPGVLSDLVSTNGLTASADAATADQLVVLTTNEVGLIYYYYWLQNAAGWTKITTTKLMPDGSSQAVTPPDANLFPLTRGLGFWIKRYAATPTTVYVKGQVWAAKQSTLISEGLNLVGYGAMQEFTLNNSGIDWSGANGANGIGATTDRILVGNGNGTYTTYYYYVKPGATGYYATFTNKWVKSTATGPELPGATTIPAGQGFWYLRRGTGSFTFHPDGQ